MSYKRSPTAAPMAARSGIPSRYQVASKGACISLQCEAYTVADAAQAKAPHAAPASRSRFGASRRAAPNMVTKIGAERRRLTVQTLQQHRFQTRFDGRYPAVLGYSFHDLNWLPCTGRKFCAIVPVWLCPALLER